MKTYTATIEFDAEKGQEASLEVINKGYDPTGGTIYFDAVNENEAEAKLSELREIDGVETVCELCEHQMGDRSCREGF